MISLEAIRAICTGRIAIGEPLAGMTTFRLGGPADLFVEPMSASEVVALQRYAAERSIPMLVLGRGSNILVSDEGFRGIVINLERGFSQLDMQQEIVTAGAGVRLSAFVDFCIRHGYGGTEMLAGIPGTLGGAVVMNAGAYGGEISTYIVDVTIVRNGEVIVIPREKCGFRYRASDLGDSVVLSTRFILPPGDREAMQRRRRDLLLERNAKQPTTLPTAGCTFKNPPGTTAAELIEHCGLKGFSIGGAEVSELHANFIVARRESTARDVLDIINHVRAVVYEKTGKELQLEIRLVGFPDGACKPLPLPGNGGAK
ncbi:MAG: UDP-N-acetylmuramate dehydrogenase [Bacteroidota bacterium]|nr:UDP-N-acetylmuramate dehydrogenase [Bacteroidota bacterium]